MIPNLADLPTQENPDHVLSGAVGSSLSLAFKG